MNKAVEVSIDCLEAQCFKAYGAHLDIEFDCAKTSPKEMFLAGMLGCSAYDIVTLADSHNVKLDALQLKVKGYPSEEIPARFVRLDVIYSVDSPALDSAVISWVRASVEQYCTTINTLRKGCEVYYEIWHNKRAIHSLERLV